MNNLGQLMLRHEAKVGAKIFHKTPSKNREFYCLNETTWVWRQDKTVVIYKINSSSVYKSNDGVSYRLVGKEEYERLYKAAKIYGGMVGRIYSSLLGSQT